MGGHGLRVYSIRLDSVSLSVCGLSCSLLKDILFIDFLFELLEKCRHTRLSTALTRDWVSSQIIQPKCSLLSYLHHPAQYTASFVVVARNSVIATNDNIYL